MTTKITSPHPKERRTIKRIRVGASKEFHAIATDNKKNEIKCSVDDFHFQGVKLIVNPSDISFNFNSIQKVDIIYGQKVITTLQKPTVVRNINDSTIILATNSTPEHRIQRAKDRIYAKPTFKPVVLAKDPIKMNSMLHFDVINFNSGGMLLETSLTNKHILIDFRIENAQLVLPGSGIVNISFKIKHSGLLQNRIRFGVEFLGIETEQLEAIARFSLFGSLPTANTNLDEKLKQVKSNVLKIRNLSTSVQVDQINSAEEYASVLKIRYLAYKDAGKIEDNLSFDDMSDEYDDHSIILAARIDGAIIATVRLVYYSENKMKFPFEKQLHFKDVLPNKQKNEIFEVSRLAIDPKFQGTDLVIKLFKEVARITIINKKTTVCLSTLRLRKLYTRIGFQIISKEVPHPSLSNESLALLLVNSDHFIRAKGMTATAWDHVAKDVVDNLAYANSLQKKPKRTFIILRKNIEKFLLNAKSVIHRKSKKINKMQAN